MKPSSYNLSGSKGDVLQRFNVAIYHTRNVFMKLLPVYFHRFFGEPKITGIKQLFTYRFHLYQFILYGVWSNILSAIC